MDPQAGEGMDEPVDPGVELGKGELAIVLDVGGLLGVHGDVASMHVP
jgi:hypothetical protein